MASIPGPIVLIIGIAVSVFSFFLNEKNFGLNGPYAIFLYMGLLILTYGIAKTIFWTVTKKSDDEKKEDVKQAISQAETAKVRDATQQSAFDKLQKEDYDEDRYRVVVRCPNCGLSHYVYANFCQNCGIRLR